MVRKGYYCPKLKSGLMTFAFMDGVREGTNWLPQMNECKLRQIASTPPIGDLADMCADAVGSHVEAAEDLS